MQTTVTSRLGKLVQTIDVLIIDDNQYMRKVIRNLLVNLMPLLNGAELVRIVRSPGVFPMSDVPIIMLTGHGERWRVVEAARLGVNEFLKKPVSGKALLDRIVSIIANPRPIVRMGTYYGPEPRKLFCDHVDKTPPPLPVVAGSPSIN